MMTLTDNEVEAGKNGLRVIYSGTAEWWWIVVTQQSIEIDDAVAGDEVFREAGIDQDDPESWSGRIVKVDNEEHSLLKVGDWVVCQGFDEDVIFVR